jgi:hypothetical protein
VTLISELFGRRMHLVAPATTDVVCQEDLPVPMDDGAVLLADRWVARDTADRGQPTVLVRSPYGRKQLVGLLFGRLLAERGLQVVIQSVRGPFGSDGAFSPFDEGPDGLATLRWLRAQPWHEDRIGMIGPSYLGFVQWAVAEEDAGDLAALAIQVSASQFYDQSYPGGAMSLENVISWMTLLSVQESRFVLLAMNRALRRLPSQLDLLPLGELDERATGAAVDWYREGFSYPDREHDYWARRDFSRAVPEVRAAVQLVGGWHDILLPWMLDDFVALEQAGREPHLTIGPWTHTDPALAAAGHRQGIAWLRAHLLDDPRLLRQGRVRIYVTGERSGGGWRVLDTWPPVGGEQRSLYLTPDKRLMTEPPSAGADGAGVRGYRYDPEDPTPSVGGPILLGRKPVVDNRELEARNDVLTYTTEPLQDVFEAIGDVRVRLWARGDHPDFDLFARVCDVDGEGASWNVCDGIVRVSAASDGRGPDGSASVEIRLWPIAHRFDAGHRLRLQVSSGAHPRYARNPGTGEDPETATRTQPVEVEILHGEGYPSVLMLPASE